MLSSILHRPGSGRQSPSTAICQYASDLSLAPPNRIPQTSTIQKSANTAKTDAHATILDHCAMAPAAASPQASDDNGSYMDLSEGLVILGIVLAAILLFLIPLFLFWFSARRKQRRLARRKRREIEGTTAVTDSRSRPSPTQQDPFLTDDTTLAQSVLDCPTTASRGRTARRPRKHGSQPITKPITTERVLGIDKASTLKDDPPREGKPLCFPKRFINCLPC